MFIGKYNKSLILTYFGVAVAVFGIYLSFSGKMKYAFLCLIISGVCDLFDGKVAKMCKRTKEEKQFGVEIDSLADLINFVALPIAMYLGMGFDKWYNVVAFVLYTLAAIERLGHFNVVALGENGDKNTSYYSGLPVTYVALIFPLLWVVGFWVSDMALSIIYSVAMPIITLLFVLNIKVTKPKGLGYVFFGLLAIILSTTIIIF